MDKQRLPYTKPTVILNEYWGDSFAFRRLHLAILLHNLSYTILLELAKPFIRLWGKRG